MAHEIERGVEIVRQMLQSPNKKHTAFDQTMYAYQVAGAVYTFVDNQKTELKKHILLDLPNVGKKRLSAAEYRVADTGVTSRLSLFEDKFFSLDAQVRKGQSYVDMEELRSELRIPQSKWDASILKATKSRSPSVILNVIQR